MSSCSGMNAKQLRESREYYNRLFGMALGWYNSYVHPYVYQPLCLLGVFANICVIVVLLRPSMRRNPFNIFLIAIAVCDMTLMATYFIYKGVEMCHPWYFEYGWIVFTYGYAVLSVFVHSASLWITVNMAVLRYLVLRSSASSNSSMPKLNTYSAACVAIAAALLISLVGSAPNMLRYEIRDNGMSRVPDMCLSNRSPYADYYASDQEVHAYTLGQPTFWSCRWERLSFWTAGLMLKLIPCFLLTVFMTLLVRMLMEARERRLRLCQRGGAKIASIPNDGTANGQPVGKVGRESAAANAERTTAMLTIIVAVFLVTELPQGILVMTIGVQPQLHNLIDLLSLVNSSVNFILYSTMSNLFRNEFLRTFGQLCFCVRSELCAWTAPAGALCGCGRAPIDEEDGGANGRQLTSRAPKERHSGRSVGHGLNTPNNNDAATSMTLATTTAVIDDSGRPTSALANGSNGTSKPRTVSIVRPTVGVDADANTLLIRLDTNAVLDVAFDESGETVLC